MRARSDQREKCRRCRMPTLLNIQYVRVTENVEKCRGEIRNDSTIPYMLMPITQNKMWMEEQDTTQKYIPLRL